MQKRQYENIRWDFPSRCWGQNSTSLRSFSRPHKCICINAQCKYLTAVTNGVRATNEAILELIWRWSSGVLHGSSSLCLLPLMHAEQCEQTDQLMVKWHDKVWKWRTVTTHTHTHTTGDLILSLLLALGALLTKQAHSAHFTVYPLIHLWASITCQQWPTAYTRDCVCLLCKVV